MFVEVVIAGFVPADVTVRRLFFGLTELIRVAWLLQRRDLSQQRWTGQLGRVHALDEERAQNPVLNNRRGAP